MAGRPRVLIVLASGLLLALAGCSSNDPTPEPDVVLDLLHQDWQHTPGVTAAGGGLQVAATARSIVEQDGGGGQPNPPLNLAGTHLVAKGDFTLSASFSDVTADASWTVYDSPPVIADEFRIEPAGLRLTLRGDDLEIAVFDGSRQQRRDRPSAGARRARDGLGSGGRALGAPVRAEAGGRERREHRLVAAPRRGVQVGGALAGAVERRRLLPGPVPHRHRSGGRLADQRRPRGRADRAVGGRAAGPGRPDPAGLQDRCGGGARSACLGRGLRAGARRQLRRPHAGERDEAAVPLTAAGRVHLRRG